VGVSYPEKVRLLKVYQIPLPEHPDLRAAVKITQLISPQSIGFISGMGFLSVLTYGETAL
jgi:hypothetical protein